MTDVDQHTAVDFYELVRQHLFEVTQWDACLYCKKTVVEEPYLAVVLILHAFDVHNLVRWHNVVFAFGALD